MGRVRPEAAPARSVVTSFAPPADLVADPIHLNRVPLAAEPTRDFLVSFVFFPGLFVQPLFANRVRTAPVRGFAFLSGDDFNAPRQDEAIFRMSNPREK